MSKSAPPPGTGDITPEEARAILATAPGVTVVDDIANTKTDWNDRPVEDVIMKTVTVETFGATYAEPEKM